MLGRRHRRSVAALGLVLLVVTSGACATDRKLTQPPPKKVTEKLLAAQVLAASDFGEGFTDKKTEVPINSELLAGTKCDDALKDVKAAVEASDSYQSGDGVTAINQVAYLPGGQAGHLNNVLDDLYDDCSKVVLAKDGVSIRTLPLQFGTLTNNTKAFKIETESDTGPIQEHDYIFIRKGDLVDVVQLKGDRPIDTAITDRAVRAAIGNVGTLANET